VLLPLLLLLLHLHFTEADVYGMSEFKSGPLANDVT
jgi:hypothetical protein